MPLPRPDPFERILGAAVGTLLLIALLAWNIEIK
jgi:hypothetical protein